MDSLTNAIVVGIIILLIMFYMTNQDIRQIIDLKQVCNDLDGRCYKVVHKYDEASKASELLASLNMFSLTLMRHLRNKYIWNYHPNQAAKDFVGYLLFNYNPDGIIENNPDSDVNTSYVDDKGKVFALCLREKLSGMNKFQPLHDLQFVVLHEMAHMATYSFGHEEDFWVAFKFLLTEAKEIGIHEPIDYSKKPMNYCSLPVSYNPYFDKSV